MRQLSGHDAAFLYADNPHANANITFVQIYDQSTAPGGTVRFKQILAHIESRLHRLPVFRQKLLRMPLEIDLPYWVDDEHFDLEYHVRHIALPKPGDWRQFCIQASRIHARALDLDRPLWEMYVIEGLDSLLELPQGSFAVLTKVHHAAVDVGRRNEIVELLHDLVPQPRPPAPPEPWFPEPVPGQLKLMARGAVGMATAPWRLAAPLWRALPTALTFARDLLRPQHAHGTRFNSVVSPHRVFDTRRFALDEFKAIRALVPGASVNDAVLAVCGGGLRAYLAHHGELGRSDLFAMAPISIRGADGAEPGRPAIDFIEVGLGTHLADPVDRLRHIHAQTSSSSVVARAVSARELTNVDEHAPAATLALTSKLFGKAFAARRAHLPLPACTITNVPGPAVPIYLQGARMTYFSAILPVSDGMGLAFAVTSYDGRIIVSPTSCRELMPDPLIFTQGVRDAFQELLERARALPPADAALRPGPRRSSASGTRHPTPPSARKAASGPRAARAGRPRSTAPSH